MASAEYPLSHRHSCSSIGISHITVTTPDKDGYIGLLLVFDNDTKFPQAYPIRDYTALAVATTTVLFSH